MLFVFFYHVSVNIAPPDDSSLVLTIINEMIAPRSNVLVTHWVFILSYAHFSLYFGGK